MPDSRPVDIFTDGASRGNPGPAAIGYMIVDSDGRVMEKRARSIGEKTNNVAEYEAIIWAMERALALGYTRVRIFSDSELVVRQVTRVYTVNKEHLRACFERVQELRKRFDSVEVRNLPREDRRISQVDALVNLELDKRR